MTLVLCQHFQYIIAPLIIYLFIKTESVAFQGQASLCHISALSLTLEMLDNAPETVAMGSNQHPFSLFDLWNDFVVPERQRPGDGVLETLTGWKLVIREVSITPVLEQKAK